MPEVIIAIGSNMGDRLEHLKAAVENLSFVTTAPMRVSSVYESEPVGPGSTAFLNAVVAIQTKLKPDELLPVLKECERGRGRDLQAPRWTDRPLDMDIIGWGNRTFRTAGGLYIPHASYRDRLFVLLPLRDTNPNWTDPGTRLHVDQLIVRAMPMHIIKTEYALN
jgi:2-amino-4-hydroxy-6-hydroxymethyldihydropteridine diphosphokinase